MDKADYQLGITKVFFRAGKLAFLDALTGSEYKELAPDIANKVRVWLIKKRWRRHTIAVVAFLKLQRFLADLRLVREFLAAARFMTLMANRPMLSVKRARQIRIRNASIRMQARARALIFGARYHQLQWATRLVERTYRGHMARKRNGGRLAEIRTRRKEEEAARRQAAEEERKVRDKEEMERIREMARQGGGAPLSTQSAARYNSKNRPAKDSSSVAASTGSAPGSTVVLSDELESRLRKLEELANQVPGLRNRVAQLEDELAHTKQQLEKRGVVDKQDSSRALRERSRSMQPGAASSMQPAVAAANAGRARRQSTVGTGKSSWGMSVFDLLGISQAPGGQLAAAPSAAPPSTTKPRRESLSGRPQQVKLDKTPTETLSGLEVSIKQIGKHFAQAEVAGSTVKVEDLGNDRKNKDIAVLVRGQLCTALSRVLLHGFKSYKLIGRYHIWDFVQESCEATTKRLDGGAKSDAERTLLAAVVAINSHDGMANNPNIKFRSFVCCGLNDLLLHEWVRVLTVDKETMIKFYENWAFVNTSAEALPQLIDALQPLSTHVYDLSLDYELTRWDLH